MKWIFSILPLIACPVLFASASKWKGEWLNDSPGITDTVNSEPTLASLVRNDNLLYRSSWSLQQLDQVISENRNTGFTLGKSKEGRDIHAYYIPGTSDQRALVIGGVHGSELSAIEVAYRLVTRLIQGKQPYYSVIIVPSLFPDNAIRAISEPGSIGGTSNIGRYSCHDGVDPNRQMPTPGKAYDERSGLDHAGRKIEKENQLLLQLIQDFQPRRIANLHAIRDPDYGGVYADPRTDHNGIALGYASDSALAVDIAAFIHTQGGRVAGNKLDKAPTALYYKDPLPAGAGNWQKRNMTGSALAAKRGSGVSLGTWASTAIAHEKDPAKNREAIRILTIEYPGYKRAADYYKESQQLFQFRQTDLFAAAIETIFLGQFYTEQRDEKGKGQEEKAKFVVHPPSRLPTHQL